MGRTNRAIGEIGEIKAFEFLEGKGYSILETNLRTPFGEIDAVARQKDFIVFVEVKTRASYSFGPPSLSVTKLKKRRLIKNALFYLKRYGSADSNWRIDVVSVNLNLKRQVENIEIIENAVEGDY